MTMEQPKWVRNGSLLLSTVQVKALAQSRGKQVTMMQYCLLFPAFHLLFAYC